jgi:pyruvate/2-oxoglutarate dehydrogenase complex dihydrolipoamide dehydrogenase (E3) component
MPWAGGQLSLAVRNPRRQDLQGIIDWRVEELKRLGVEVIYNHPAELDDITSLESDVVIVATGGLPQLPPLETGQSNVITSWDVLSGEFKPEGSVLFYDDNGTHSSLSAAELLAQTGINLEIVTPERTLGVDVGGVNHVPYARSFNENEVRVTLNQRVLRIEKNDSKLKVDIGSDYSDHFSSRVVDWVVVDHGTLPNADLYFELKPYSNNGGEVDYDALLKGNPQPRSEDNSKLFDLYRIGDAVANRNIHAAVYDALRLVKDI